MRRHEFTNDARELRVEVLHRAVGEWSGAFGVQLGDRAFAALGEEAFVPPVDTSTMGLFIVEQRDVASWELSARRARRPAGAHAVERTGPIRRERDERLARRRAAVRRRLRLRGDAGARRIGYPSPRSSIPNGPHLATDVVQIGDAALTAETARHVDVGVRGEHGALTWSVATFATRYDDFIYLADTGEVDSVAELPIFAYRQADADFIGIEAEVLIPLLAEGSRPRRPALVRRLRAR